MNADSNSEFGGEPIEDALGTAFAVMPPAHLSALVRSRVAAAAETAGAQPKPETLRRSRRVLLAAAAVLVIGAAGVLAFNDFGQMLGPSHVTVVQGTPLDLAEVSSGWRVSLARAYADAGQLMLWIHAEGVEDDIDSTFVSAENLTVTDDRGTRYRTISSGHSWVADDASSNLVAVAPLRGRIPTGQRTFSVSLESLQVQAEKADAYVGTASGPGVETETGNYWFTVPGPWTFEFPLDVHAGTVLRPGVSDEQGGVTITLGELAISPSRLEGRLTIEGAPAGIDWMPVLRVTHDGQEWEELGGTEATEVDGIRTVVFAGLSPSDAIEPAGRWEIEVISVGDYDQDDDVLRHSLPGSWDLSFEVERPR